MGLKWNNKILFDNKLTTSGSLFVGQVGTGTVGLKHGSVTFAVPQFTASGTTVAVTATVSNIPVGAKVFLMPDTTTGGSGIFAVAAKVASASVISASFGIANHAATGGTCNVSFNYLAIW